MTTITPEWGPGADPVAIATGDPARTKGTETALPTDLTREEPERKPEEPERNSPNAPSSATETPDEKAGSTTEARKKSAEALAAASRVKEMLSPNNGQPFSFAWAVMASWAVGPQTAIAAYDRITRSSNPADWGFLYGPGRWMRDTIGGAWETGNMTSFYIGVLAGCIPMLVTSIPASVLRSEWAAWGIIGGFAVYFTGADSHYQWWATFQGWQLQLATLVALAYYCTHAAYTRKKKADQAISQARADGLDEEVIAQMNNGSGLTQMLLLMPAASIFCVVLYAPGAAF